jgi:protein-S-isoprenylcysteine O-methyltransferase Ste14
MAVCVLSTFAVGAAYWTGTHPVMEKSLFILGLGIASIGAAGRAWATSYISGQKLTRLVKTGPYSMCRNPLYFFSMLLGIGFGFCTETLTMPIVVTAVLTCLYYFQIRNEERRLHLAFGAEYESYVTQVPRFFPSSRSFYEPDEITISPKLMKKGLFGIAFLLLLIGVFELLQGLHQSEMLPTLFHIY